MTDPLGAAMEEPPDRHGAFPRLDDEQRARLRMVGDLRAVRPGEVLFRAGDAGYDFFAVESGTVAIVQGYGSENRVIAVTGRIASSARSTCSPARRPTWRRWSETAAS
jgi:NhaA family Na+:H+ antiporter